MGWASLRAGVRCGTGLRGGRGVPAVGGARCAFDKGEGAIKHAVDAAAGLVDRLQVRGELRRLDVEVVAAKKSVVQREAVALGDYAREAVVFGREALVVMAAHGIDEVRWELPLLAEGAADVVVGVAGDGDFGLVKRFAGGSGTVH